MPFYKTWTETKFARMAVFFQSLFSPRVTILNGNAPLRG